MAYILIVSDNKLKNNITKINSFTNQTILKLQAMFKQNGIKHFFSIRIVGRRFNVLLHTVINLPSKSANSRAPSMHPTLRKAKLEQRRISTKQKLSPQISITRNLLRPYANFHCGPIHAPRQRSLSVTVSRGQQPKDVMHSVA